MKKRLLRFIIITYIFITSSNNVLSQSWEWAQQYPVYEAAIFAADSVGNSYVSLYTQDSIFMGGDTLPDAPTLGNTCYYAKFAPNGNYVWMISIPFGNYAAATFNSDHLYVTGVLRDTLFYNSDTIIPQGLNDAAIAKIDTNGTLVWIKVFGGLGEESVYSIESDEFGNVYVGGSCNTTFTVDTDSIICAPVGLTSFVLKLDPIGTLLWSGYSGGTGYANGYEMEIDVFGNVFCSGVYSGGTLQWATAIFPVSGLNNYFITKYDQNGNFQWCRTGGAYGFGQQTVIEAITSDENGNIYGAGRYYGNPAQVDTAVLTGAVWGPDGMLIKYNANGDFQWVKPLHTDYGFLAANLHTDQNQNLLFLAIFTGDSLNVSGHHVCNPNNDDVSVIMSFDTSGVLRYIQRPYSLGAGALRGRMALDGLNNILFSFEQLDTAQFCSNVLPQQTSGFYFVTMTKMSMSPPVTFIMNTNEVCAGDSVTLNLQSNCNFDCCNSFIAQLSDSLGSFDVPINLDTLVGISPSPMSFETPPVSPGNGYKVRVITTCPFNKVIQNEQAFSIQNVAPIASFTYSSLGPQIDLSNTSIAGNTYNWDFGDGNTSGENGPSYTYGNAGTYYICLEAFNGCGSDQFCDSITLFTTGIIHLEYPQLEIFPNPFQDQLSIVLPKEPCKRIEIVGVLGQTVLVKHLHNQSGVYSINTKDLDTGFYIINVYAENDQNYTSTIIKN
ncbi:MAG: hypothetical protein ACI8SE_001992 [Bacteroidia bacterium]|jgi:hypothetical protein